MARVIKTGIIAVVALSLAAGAFADQYDIPLGTVTVDGNLSDWGGTTWIPLDLTYWSSTGSFPADITNAAYAAKWSSATNKIYLAVTADDSDQTLTSGFVEWNAQDDVELYIDAGNRDHDDPVWEPQDYAQQYHVGADGNGGAWATFAGTSGATPPAGVIDAAAGVSGATITYEAALTPYYYYTGLGGADEAESIVTLAAGQTVGLDVVVCSRFSGTEFGMVSNNTDPNKYKFENASALQDHLLVPKRGDADGDGLVDSADLATWQQNYDPLGDNENTFAMGDWDSNGLIDSADLAIWQQNYDPIGGSALITHTPEPATLALLALGGLVMLRRRRT
jgi:hypothetical protein